MIRALVSAAAVTALCAAAMVASVATSGATDFTSCRECGRVLGVQEWDSHVSREHAIELFNTTDDGRTDPMEGAR